MISYLKCWMHVVYFLFLFLNVGYFYFIFLKYDSVFAVQADFCAV